MDFNAFNTDADAFTDLVTNYVTKSNSLLYYDHFLQVTSGEIP